jgi:hypothetical protein
MLAGGSERRGGQLGESVANQATQADGDCSELMCRVRMRDADCGRKMRVLVSTFFLNDF